MAAGTGIWQHFYRSFVSKTPRIGLHSVQKANQVKVNISPLYQYICKLYKNGYWNLCHIVLYTFWCGIIIDSNINFPSFLWKRHTEHTDWIHWVHSEELCGMCGTMWTSWCTVHVCGLPCRDKEMSFDIRLGYSLWESNYSRRMFIFTNGKFQV